MIIITTKLMNHLGGKWSEWVILSGFPGFYRGISLENGHPGTKGPMFLQVKMIFVQPRVIWALS